MFHYYDEKFLNRHFGMQECLICAVTHSLNVSYGVDSARLHMTRLMLRKRISPSLTSVVMTRMTRDGKGCGMTTKGGKGRALRGSKP